MSEKAVDPYTLLGICPRCHKGILGNQYKTCADCREKKAKAQAKSFAMETPEQAEMRKARVRAAYYMNKSKGICVKCSKRKTVYGTVLCGRCLAKRRLYDESKYTSQREYREDKGLCILCGEHAVLGKKHCEKHLEMLRKQAANARSHIDYTKHPWVIDNKRTFGGKL